MSRRLPSSAGAPKDPSTLLTVDDLGRFLLLGRDSKVTLDVDQIVAEALRRIPPATVVADPPRVFEGAGFPGLVPDPITETGLFLRDDGTWQAGGGGGGAPTTADYLVKTADAGLSAERVVTDTAEIIFDWATVGQVKANVGAIAEAKVTNLVADLAALTAAIYTDEKAQDAVGAMVDASLTYVDATPLLQRAALTGDVTAPAGSNTTAIGTNKVVLAMMQQLAAGSVLGRDVGAGTGNVTSLTLATTPAPGCVPRGNGAAGQLDPTIWLTDQGASEPAVLCSKIAGNVAWVLFNVGKQVLINKADPSDVVAARYAHTAFPSTPAEGQWCWRDDHDCWYVYDGTAGWLSSHIHEVEFGIDADTAATAYLKFGDQSGDTTFSSTIGHLIGVQVKVVGISLNMAASGTATVQVFDDGSAVTGATLALSGQQSKADETLMSNAIGASSILGVKVTSGTVEGPARGKVRFRRYET